jgi:SAM-dependent methyltransferase
LTSFGRYGTILSVAGLASQPMSTPTDQDYVLGTHDEEIERLGLQHRLWRPPVLRCWQNSGIADGSRVVDVGCGPGYATIDLAEIVGPAGEVVAVERSSNFAKVARAACAQRGLNQVRVHELDLMRDPIPAEAMDFAWCRWVASFVSDPAVLVDRIAACLRPGGRAIFFEYSAYASFLVAPPCPEMHDFIGEVMASWRDAGGEPDIAGPLVGMLARAGFSITQTTPHILCARPGDHVWQWPKVFVDINLRRMVDLGRVDEGWAGRVREAFAAAERDPNTVLVTPLVLEIVAERLA